MYLKCCIYNLFTTEYFFRDHCIFIFIDHQCVFLGILDSAVRTSDHCGKLFQLRDENDATQCVFYEIVSLYTSGALLIRTSPSPTV